jgi:glycosyltransferase involved in cell wall biosynthesis
MISVIIPAYNEEENLGRCVASIKAVLESLPDDFEIIIAEDGSTDGTKEIAGKLADDPKIIYIHSNDRLGKGASISNAFSKARGDILCFTDADLSADPNDLVKLIDSIKSGFDIAIGSRALTDSVIKRSFMRRTFSRVYNHLSRYLFHLPITDIQCGFKAFSRRILEIIPSIREKGFFWDTELIFKASKNGFKIKEVAIRWREANGSKINLFSDSFRFFYKALKLRFRS